MKDKDQKLIWEAFESSIGHGTDDYRDKANVNGIEIHVGRPLGASGDTDFEIYIPAVEVDYDNGPFDQVMRVSEDPDVARDVFDQAIEMAEHASNPNELYKEVEEYARNRPTGEEDWPEIDPDMTRSERWDIAEDMLKAGEDADKIKELLFPDMGRYDWSANLSYMRGGDYPGKHGEPLD